MGRWPIARPEVRGLPRGSVWRESGRILCKSHPARSAHRVRRCSRLLTYARRYGSPRRTKPQPYSTPNVENKGQERLPQACKHTQLLPCIHRQRGFASVLGTCLGLSLSWAAVEIVDIEETMFGATSRPQQVGSIYAIDLHVVVDCPPGGTTLRAETG